MQLGPGLERVTDGHVAPGRHRNCQPGADHSKRRHQTLPPCRATFIVRTVGVACVKKDVVHKTGSKLHDIPHDYRNRTRPRPRHRKLDEIWTIGFFGYACEQTDMLTGTLIEIRLTSHTAVTHDQCGARPTVTFPAAEQHARATCADNWTCNLRGRDGDPKVKTGT